MKRRWLSAGIAAVGTLLLCLILFYLAPARNEAQQELVVWYAESECDAEQMRALAARCEKQTLLRVVTVGYPDENALAAACAEGRPDLLWCSHLRASEIAGSGLAALPAGMQSPVRAAEGFYPLGARLPLLLRDPARLPETPQSLEALLTGGEKDVLAAESWADLLFEAMTALGRPMTGKSGADSASAEYVRLYNLLARAAYDGAVVNETPAADCVLQGRAAAAVVDSMRAAELKDAALAVDPLPLPEGGQTRRAVVWMGFAVLRPDAPAARFLSWLSEKGQGTEAALSLGLAPTDPAGAEGKTALDRALLTAAKGALSGLDPGCSYLENRADCERRLRLSLDLLA